MAISEIITMIFSVVGRNIGCSMVSIWLICMQLNSWSYDNYHGRIVISHSPVRSQNNNRSVRIILNTFILSLHIHLLIRNTNFKSCLISLFFDVPQNWKSPEPYEFFSFLQLKSVLSFSVGFSFWITKPVINLN